MREPLTLMSASRAEDGAYLALADVATTAGETNTEYRVIGGHMVTLHMARHPFAALVARQTADADVGLEPLVLAASGMIDALGSLGYQLSGGNRFVRELDGLTLAIDVLVPADTSRVHHNRPVAGLMVDEVPGLRYAIARPPLLTELRVRLTTGHAFDITTTIPDIVSALCLKPSRTSRVWNRVTPSTSGASSRLPTPTGSAAKRGLPKARPVTRPKCSGDASCAPTVRGRSRW